jgi:hypothetical protein
MKEKTLVVNKQQILITEEMKQVMSDIQCSPVVTT